MEDRSVLVIGSSMQAVQTALGKADAGRKVVLVEMLPRSGSERFGSSNGSALDDATIRSLWEQALHHENIQIISNADLDITKVNGSYQVTVTKSAPRVLEDKCNDCKECFKVCPVNMWDDANEGLRWRTAVDVFHGRSTSYNIHKERPVCERTCPINLDIRGYIGLIADGKYKESLALIREKLPFPASIGRVCPHPCEDACNRGQKDEAPRIRDLKRFVADYEVHTNRQQPLPKIGKNGRKVAVIGAGPAGLTCAHDLALRGYSITVFEALPVGGGMMAVGIPKYRLPWAVLNREIDFIKSLGVEIKYETRIGVDLTLDDLFQQGYEAVFIGVGCHLSQSARVKGENIEGVVPGVSFLRDLNLGKDVWVGQKVGIIGGGNVAMDAARCSLRRGAKEVTVLYRRSRQEMPASGEEIEAAMHEGITFEFLVAPSEVVPKDGTVGGLKCTRMKLGEPDASGRRSPIPIEGSDFVVELDMLIPAIGQKADLSFLPKDGSMKVTDWGTIIVDDCTGATSRAGVFSGGDCVTGPWIAIGAIADGKRAAKGIDAYLKNK